MRTLLLLTCGTYTPLRHHQGASSLTTSSEGATRDYDVTTHLNLVNYNVKLQEWTFYPSHFRWRDRPNFRFKDQSIHLQLRSTKRRFTYPGNMSLRSTYLILILFLVKFATKVRQNQIVLFSVFPLSPTSKGGEVITGPLYLPRDKVVEWPRTLHNWVFWKLWFTHTQTKRRGV